MNATDVFTRIAEQLIADIDAGTAEWRIPRHCLADVGTPVSIDRRPYRGINSLILSLVASEHGWAGTFGTFKAFARRGTFVRRGERGTHVILWKTTERSDTNDLTDDEPSTVRRGLVARTFVVFPVCRDHGYGVNRREGSPWRRFAVVAAFAQQEAVESFEELFGEPHGRSGIGETFGVESVGVGHDLASKFRRYFIPGTYNVGVYGVGPVSGTHLFHLWRSCELAFRVHDKPHRRSCCARSPTGQRRATWEPPRPPTSESRPNLPR